MPRQRRIRLVLLLLPCLLFLLGGGAFYAAVWGTLPAQREEVAIPSLSAPVQISFDPHGIPVIHAQHEDDAWAAMGWLHARDRLFQMEMMRRGAAGRLAEILGPAGLRSDRFVRILGLRESANADYQALPRTAQKALESYSDGVNAWIAAHGRFSGPEFALLGSPAPWRPQDCLLWAKVMGLWLSGNWHLELDRARLASSLSPAMLQGLWPLDPSLGRPDLPNAATPDVTGDSHLRHTEARPTDGAPASFNPMRLAALLQEVPRFPTDAPLPSTASNAWAVSGAHSRSGGAMLANDPHLGFQAPIFWYLARIELPGGRWLAGATAPGVPFVVIGRNQGLAWGFTSTGADTQDVFVERLVGADHYATPDGPAPFSVRHEHIAIRGQPPLDMTVRITRHGPLISDLEPGSAPPGMALALAMAALDGNDSSAAGLLALNRASTVAEARQAAAQITSPVQNLMLADTAGHIALALTGRIPLRASGDGSLPAPGWDGSADWAALIEPEDLPFREDPASGVLANANNRVLPPDSPVFLGRDWPGDWRFRRIGQLLAATPQHDEASFARIQTDTLSLLAVQALGLLHSLPAAGGIAGEAQAVLATWNGDMQADAAAPLIYTAWMQRYGALALARGGVPPAGAPARAEFMRPLLAADAQSPWCGGRCAPLAAEALQEAVEQLAPALGPHPARWRWGNVHQARFDHPAVRLLPHWLRFALRIAGPVGGDGQTVAQAAFDAPSPDASAVAKPLSLTTLQDFYADVHGPGMRFVADLGAGGGAYAVIATGQSGRPASPHWRDLWPLWNAGQLVDLGHLQTQPGPTLRP